MMLSAARVVAHVRHEPADSLDYFPTPPWAVRALFHHVLGRRGFAAMTVEEPACGEGHMAYALEDFFGRVLPSDVHDYGVGAPVRDFLDPAAWVGIERPDWIITNPPFGVWTIPFMRRALSRAIRGVAMFLRTTQLEGIGRFREVYRPHPPTIVAPYAERVPLHKGRWEPEGDTHTAYCWIVWRLDRPGRDTRVVWIPPCRARLHYARDLARFGRASV